MSRDFLSKFGPLIIILIFFGVFLSPNETSAKGIDDWSWGNGPAVVSSSEDVADTSGASNCPTYYAERDAVGYSHKLKVCISNSGKIEFGKYYDGRSFLTFIKFPTDTKMRRLGLDCTQRDDCLYLSQTDTFVKKRHTINTLVQDLSIYNDFSKKVKPVFNLTSGYSYYSFDDSVPDYVYTDGGGYHWPVESLSVSNNGRWLAVEIRGKGVGIFDPVTLTMRKVVDDVYPYGMGYNPKMELAVGNNGDVLALAGFNVNFSVYYVPQSCGIVTIHPNQRTVDYNKACSRVSTPIYGLFDRFYMAMHPWFNDQSSEISFFGLSYTGQQKEIVLKARDYEPDNVDYLALGDSFSSGEGETSDAFYADGTNTASEKCHLSSRSYPYVLSKLLDLNPLYVKSVACSGATTNDIVGQNSDYWGQGDRLVVGSKELSAESKTISQTGAREHFIPGRVKQETFVGAYLPKFMTVGIGGNDVGFMEKLQTCIGIDICEWAEEGAHRYRTAQEIGTLYDKLVDMYTELHINSPKTIIYAIGYPKVISPTGDCGVLYNTLLNAKEKEFMDQGIVYLNKVIKAAASRVGIGYIDTYDSLGDRVLCGTNQDTAMNAVRFGDDEKIIDILPTIIGHESFHPNPLGHNLIARSISSYLGIFNIYVNQGCAINYTICPDNTVGLPDPGDYWSNGYDNQDKEVNQRISNSSQAISSDSRSRTVSVEEGSFSPNSDVRVELHSNPVVLGEFLASELGGLEELIEIPKVVADGYHTLHIYGASSGGDLIDLYQVVYIGEPKLADDGKTNTEDGGETIKTKGVETKAVVDYSSSVTQLYASNSRNTGDSSILGDSTNESELSPAKGDSDETATNHKTDVWLLALYASIGLFVVACLIFIHRRHRTKRP